MILKCQETEHELLLKQIRGRLRGRVNAYTHVVTAAEVTARSTFLTGSDDCFDICLVRRMDVLDHDFLIGWSVFVFPVYAVNRRVIPIEFQDPSKLPAVRVYHLLQQLANSAVVWDRYNWLRDLVEL